MARRVEKKAKAAPKGAAAVNADQGAEILQPNREIQVAGETIVVREYLYFDGLKLKAWAKPFLEDLYALFGQGDAAPSFDDIAELLGRHEETVVQMVAQSVGKTPEWLRELGEADGDLVTLTWWMVNSGFFTRPVMRRAIAARLAGRSPGPASTTSSPAADTSAHPTTSVA
jgi:hypothetical protein